MHSSLTCHASPSVSVAMKRYTPSTASPLPATALPSNLARNSVFFTLTGAVCAAPGADSRGTSKPTGASSISAETAGSSTGSAVSAGGCGAVPPQPESSSDSRRATAIFVFVRFITKSSSLHFLHPARRLSRRAAKSRAKCAKCKLFRKIV